MTTIVFLTLAFSVSTPGAIGGNEKGNGKGYGHGRVKKQSEKIESAAVSLSAVIASDSGGSGERYHDYAVRLAKTLDQKSSSELNFILGSSNHFGLGN